jgi:hypothetical protein
MPGPYSSDEADGQHLDFCHLAFMTPMRALAADPRAILSVNSWRLARHIAYGGNDRGQGGCAGVRPKLIPDDTAENSGPYRKIPDPKQWLSFHPSHPHIQCDFLRTILRRSFIFRR